MSIDTDTERGGGVGGGGGGGGGGRGEGGGGGGGGVFFASRQTIANLIPTLYRVSGRKGRRRKKRDIFLRMRFHRTAI